MKKVRLTTGDREMEMKGNTGQGKNKKQKQTKKNIKGI